jgi:hypothetical protein
MNDKTTNDILINIDEHIKQYKPKYVRIVPNCQASQEQQEENNRHYSELVAQWGEPYFYQAKNFSRPDHCWWGYFKPFINYNGDVFRCSSVVLNSDSDKTFHKRYKWCDVSELPDKYKTIVEEYSPEWCDHCVFRPQNDMVDSLFSPTDMKNFI